MATKCLKPVRGRALRITTLDLCGRPVYGPESRITSEGIVSVAITVNTETTEAISVTNFNGDRCVSEPARSTVTGLTAVITFCDVDPDVYIATTGATAVLDAFGNTIGFDVDTNVSPSDIRWALEVWTGMAGGGAACAEGSQGQFGYVLLPMLQGGTVGDYTIENGAVSFSIANATSVDGNSWGTGPYPVVLDSEGEASVLLAPITTTTHHRFIITEVAPPEGECGFRPLLDPTDAALTGITAVADDLDVTVTAAPSGSDPFWADFGDGTWDYSEAGTALVHTYDAPGTYTVTAWRGTSKATTTATPTAP